MFGYVTVDKSEMLGKDFEAYKAIYCSLCKQLGKDYGVLSRFILSYDCTFFAVLSFALKDECAGFCQGRCKFNPLKKCNYLKNDTESLSLAAALSVITAYYKLRDNIADGGFFEKLLCYMLLPLFSSWHKKAAKKYEKIEKAVFKMSKSQFDVEADKNCSIDKASEPTAKMLSDIMSMLVPYDDASQRLVFSTFGYYLGKWIYLCDAANDYDDDLKHNGFNPYVILYKDEKSQHIFDIEKSLNYCLNEAVNSYNLMEIKRFDRIIDNILIHGLSKKQTEILRNKE